VTRSDLPDGDPSWGPPGGSGSNQPPTGYSGGSGPAPFQATPEPSGLILALLAGVGAAADHWRRQARG
jgi:hypothetical protein